MWEGKSGLNAAPLNKRHILKCSNAALIRKFTRKAAFIGRKAQKVIFYIFPGYFVVSYRMISETLF